MSDGGVGGLVQLFTQDLQLGEALDKERERRGLISHQQEKHRGHRVQHLQTDTPTGGEPPQEAFNVHSLAYS